MELVKTIPVPVAAIFFAAMAALGLAAPGLADEGLYMLVPASSQEHASKPAAAPTKADSKSDKTKKSALKPVASLQPSSDTIAGKTVSTQQSAPAEKPAAPPTPAATAATLSPAEPVGTQPPPVPTAATGAAVVPKQVVARHIPDKTFAFEQELLKRIQTLGTKGIGTKPLLTELLRIDSTFKFGDAAKAQPRLDKLAVAVTNHEKYLQERGSTSYTFGSDSPSDGADPWANAPKSNNVWGSAAGISADGLRSAVQHGKKKHGKKDSVSFMVPPPPPTPYTLVSPPPPGVVRPDQLQQLGMNYNRTR